MKRRFFGFFQKPDVAGALMGHARAFTRKLWKSTVTICEAGSTDERKRRPGRKERGLAGRSSPEIRDGCGGAVPSASFAPGGLSIFPLTSCVGQNRRLFVAKSKKRGARFVGVFFIPTRSAVESKVFRKQIPV